MRHPPPAAFYKAGREPQVLLGSLALKLPSERGEEYKNLAQGSRICYRSQSLEMLPGLPSKRPEKDSFYRCWLSLCLHTAKIGPHLRHSQEVVGRMLEGMFVVEIVSLGKAAGQWIIPRAALLFSSWQAREAEFEAEQERIRREKEKEIARLRAMQEKAQDYRAEQVSTSSSSWLSFVPPTPVAIP